MSLLSKEKSKVVLRCYQHEEAYFAEVKVREKYDFPREYYEELYNYHRDENYTFLALSRREKLCCITFERPDHTLAEVFASVSSGGQRSQKVCTTLPCITTKYYVFYQQVCSAFFIQCSLIYFHFVINISGSKNVGLC